MTNIGDRTVIYCDSELTGFCLKVRIPPVSTVFLHRLISPRVK